MTWAALIPVVLQYGLPYAEKLWQLLTTNTAPTQADFDSLRALISQKASDKMKSNLLAAGIPLDSDQGKALIAIAS